MLIVLLLTGLCTFSDYGFTVDECIERTSSVINYQYVLKTLFRHELRVVDEDLSTYRDRYYGVTLQMPTVAVEHLTGFRLQSYHVYLLRHLYTFLLCVGGYVCFYFFLRNVFGSDWLALLGALMLALYPRFWGEQFTNIKDMPFMATVCAGMLCVSLCLKHEGKWRYDVLAAFVFAVCVNTRVIGLMLPLLLLGYRVLRDWLVTHVARERGRAALWKGYARYAAQLAMTLAFYVAITPAAWEHPMEHLSQTILTFSNYDVWEGFIQFDGKMLTREELPLSYIPVWLGISLPLWYLATLIASVPVEIGRIVRDARREGWAASLLGTNRYDLFCAVIAFFPFLTMLVKEVTLYNGWRHLYYTLPAMVTMMLFAVQTLWRATRGRQLLQRATAGALCVLLVWQGVWIAREHPMEKVYFNPIGRSAAHLVERDFWMESVYHQFQFLLARDPSDPIRVSCYGSAGLTYEYFLTYQEQARLQMTTEGSVDAEYVIMTYIDFTHVPPEGYTLIREMAVDGVPISGLFIRNDVLESRFGGVYPD